MRDIWHISVHFSDSPHKHHDNVESIRQWHLERGWSDIGYHYIITKNGDIETGRPIQRVPAAVKGHNRGNIAICLTGRDYFSPSQFRSLRRLVENLMFAWEITKENVKGHNEYSGHETRGCPNFDVKQVLWGVSGVHQNY